MANHRFEPTLYNARILRQRTESQRRLIRDVGEQTNHGYGLSDTNGLRQPILG
jgi:hypothetical protein